MNRHGKEFFQRALKPVTQGQNPVPCSQEYGIGADEEKTIAKAIAEDLLA